jgi:uracil-DNA glycosylase
MPRITKQQSFGFGEAKEALDSLISWPPESLDLDAGWTDLVRDFLDSSTGQSLSVHLQAAIAAGKTVYPPTPFRALTLTPRDQLRAVILGQDPYHGPGQAEGLAFSVPKGVRIPPSLRNIFKELQQSLGTPVPADGSLVKWAQQGVLLLNTCLTVEDGLPASHAHWGWEALTDAVVVAAAKSKTPLVFMLWGSHAQTKKALIETCGGQGFHLILQANHPSPLSAMRPPMPFLGCGHFAKAQAFWQRRGEKQIGW